MTLLKCEFPPSQRPIVQPLTHIRAETRRLNRSCENPSNKNRRVKIAAGSDIWIFINFHRRDASNDSRPRSMRNSGRAKFADRGLEIYPKHFSQRDLFSKLPRFLRNPFDTDQASTRSAMARKKTNKPRERERERDRGEGEYKWVERRDEKGNGLFIRPQSPFEAREIRVILRNRRMMLLRDVNGNRTPGNVHARRHDIRYYIHIILPMLLATTNSDLLPRVLRSSLSRTFPATFTPAPEYHGYFDSLRLESRRS